MRWGRLLGLVGLALLGSVACEEDAASPEGAAGDTALSGAGGEAGAIAPGGAPGASGGGGAPAACEGDPAAWASLTAEPPICEDDEDCCVVVNSCLAEAQIVHANDFEIAQMAWPYCEADCNDCIPPVVRVFCDNGHCVGKVDTESADDGVSHCGDTPSTTGSPGQSFSCSDG